VVNHLHGTGPVTQWTGVSRIRPYALPMLSKSLARFKARPLGRFIHIALTVIKVPVALIKHSVVNTPWYRAHALMPEY
jgi:hypothetical protein